VVKEGIDKSPGKIYPKVIRLKEPLEGNPLVIREY